MNVLDLMRKTFNIDERRIYLAGHSMGGAGALFLGIKHKDIWAAVSASAPAIRTNLHTPAELEQATDMPFILIHGDADTAVPVEQTRDWAAKMKALKMTYEYREIRGGTHASTLPLGAPFTFKFFDSAPQGEDSHRARGRGPDYATCSSTRLRYGRPGPTVTQGNARGRRAMFARVVRNMMQA